MGTDLKPATIFLTAEQYEGLRRSAFEQCISIGKLLRDAALAILEDSEGDFLEVMFAQKKGYFRETKYDQVKEKVNMEGHGIGFSILKVSVLKGSPLDIDLGSVAR